MAVYHAQFLCLLCCLGSVAQTFETIAPLDGTDMVDSVYAPPIDTTVAFVRSDPPPPLPTDAEIPEPDEAAQTARPRRWFSGASLDLCVGPALLNYRDFNENYVIDSAEPGYQLGLLVDLYGRIIAARPLVIEFGARYCRSEGDYASHNGTYIVDTEHIRFTKLMLRGGPGVGYDWRFLGLSVHFCILAGVGATRREMEYSLDTYFSLSIGYDFGVEVTLVPCRWIRIPVRVGVMQDASTDLVDILGHEWHNHNTGKTRSQGSNGFYVTAGLSFGFLDKYRQAYRKDRQERAGVGK